MVQFRGLLAASIIAVAYATPIKRINQIIADSTAKWEQACLAAGGAQKCNPLSIKAFDTLLAAGGNCDQQNAADNMIDLAKTLKSNADMIRFTQIFVQQPRNAPDKLQVPYCQTAPRNAELNGLFHCQFAGSDFTKFSGDQTGNLPLGVKAVTPPGSCPAKPDGPVADGVQLDTLVNTPRPAGAAAAAPAQAAAPAKATAAAKPAKAAPAKAAPAKAAPAPAKAANNAAAAAAPGAKSFTLSNGQQAKALNAQFATLTASSPCQAGEDACVNNEFAQCVGGKFVLTPCAGGTICAALPLVNKAGTSVTCTTAADRDARIAATGAKRSEENVTRSLKSQSKPKPHKTKAAKHHATAHASALPKKVAREEDEDIVARAAKTKTKVTPTTKTKTKVSHKTKAAKPHATSTPKTHTRALPSFAKSNGQEAEALNAQFAKLTASSACQAGQEACVNNEFAQCVGGKFALTPCAGGTICAALPLVNKPGTSITCTTAADRDARIAATGAKRSEEDIVARAVKTKAKAATKTKAAAKPKATKAAAKPKATAKSFAASNAKEAKSQNASFAKLKATSSCSSGEQACVNGDFAQCIAGKFIISPCAAGLTCKAIPLVNRAGTSVICD